MKMLLKNKKIIIALLAIVVIIVVTILLFVSKRGDGIQPLYPEGGESLPDVTEKNKPEGTKTENEKSWVLRKISENPAFDFWASPEGENIYYIGTNGEIFGGKNGPDPEISTEKISALNRIESSPSNTKIIAAFGDPRAPQWAVFGISDKFWSPLPGSIIDATWGENDNQIFAISSDNAVHEIDLSKSPFGDKVAFQNLNLIDIRLVFSPNKNLFLVPKPSAFADSKIFELNIKNRSLNLALSNQKGVALNVSEDRGWSFVFSSPASFYVFDKNLNALLPPETDTSVLIPATLPEKCDAENSRIICFVPKNFNSNNPNLPDDYYSEKLRTTDDVFEINTDGVIVNLIFAAGKDPLNFVDAKKVRVRGNKVYFINRYDEALYELTLPNN